MEAILCTLLVCVSALAYRAMVRSERLEMAKRRVEDVENDRQARETVARLNTAAAEVRTFLGRLQQAERRLEDHEGRLSAHSFRRTS
jgi:hypothetical protein